MRCPFCKSDDYEYLDPGDYDEESTSLMFRCDKCGKRFDAIYSFLYYEDEDGRIIDNYG